MAEAFLRTYTGDKYEAHSAGLYPKGLNPFTVQVMEEKGISLAKHITPTVTVLTCVVQTARYEHINPYGKYQFRIDETLSRERLRPLRRAQSA